ncbi:MAG: histone deacetylase [Cyanobacteria bacterium P01_D01_bin.105]
MLPEFPVFYSDLFLDHDTGQGHPENSGRLTAVVEHLKRIQKQSSERGTDDITQGEVCSDAWSDKIIWLEPSSRTVLTHVNRVHDAAYVAALKAFAEKGGGRVDSDTVMSPQSYDLALLAVAAWLDGVDWVVQHQSPGFALVRPPGHHAEKARGMGFCLLSNAAIAAHYALNHLDGIDKVAILDWDVHHGNGTQSLVEHDERIAYCSFHQSPAYPGTGAATETGLYQNVLNIPMRPGSQLGDYQTLWELKARNFLTGFTPNLLIVSAGYDATAADPLASVALQPNDYGWFARECLKITSKTLFGLEGGYDYRALAESVAATLRSAVGL